MNLDSLYKIFAEKNLLVTTDTRTMKAGDIFFAIKGDNFDGNTFAIEKKKKGAISSYFEIGTFF